jgi:hypothetical protein
MIGGARNDRACRQQPCSLHAEQGSPASGRSRSCPNRLMPRPGSATPFFACRGAYARSALGRLVRFWGSHSAILDLPLIAVEARNMATASAYALGWSLVRGLTALESRGQGPCPGTRPRPNVTPGSDTLLPGEADSNALAASRGPDIFSLPHALRRMPLSDVRRLGGCGAAKCPAVVDLIGSEPAPGE